MPAGTFPQGLDLRSSADIISRALQQNYQTSRSNDAADEFNKATNPIQTIPAPVSDPIFRHGPAGQQMGMLHQPDTQGIRAVGVPTQGPVPLDPNSQEYQTAAMHLLNSTPDEAAKQSALDAMKSRLQPKYTPVNQEAGAFGVITTPAGGGEPSYKQVQGPQYRPGVAREISKDRMVGNEPHTFISSWDSQGNFIGERDMGVSPASQAALARTGAGGAGGTLDPIALRTMAEDWLLSGKMPPMGMGNAALRRQLYSEYGKLAQEQGMEGQARQQVAAQTQAEQKNLANIIKQKSMVMAFEKTAERNLQIALAQSGQVDRFQSPTFNRWKLYVQGQYGGDPEVARLEAAMHVAANEIAKVTSTTTGNLVPQQEREEYRKMMSTALNVEQFKGVADILRQDMKSRELSFNEEIESIKQNFPALTKSVQPVAPVGTPAPGAPAKTAPKWKFED